MLLRCGPVVRRDTAVLTIWNQVSSVVAQDISLLTASMSSDYRKEQAVTEAGVPVLVVSNESLGLPLADLPLRLVNDAEDATLWPTSVVSQSVPSDTISPLSPSPGCSRRRGTVEDGLWRTGY